MGFHHERLQRPEVSVGRAGPLRPLQEQGQTPDLPQNTPGSSDPKDLPQKGEALAQALPHDRPAGIPLSLVC